MIMHRWNHFFHRDVPPHLIAIVRIAFGLFLMIYWGERWSQAVLFSPAGLQTPAFVSDVPLFHALFFPSLFGLHIFFGFTFIVLISFTLGVAVRTSTAMLLGCFFYFYILTQWMFMTSFFRLFIFTLIVFLLPGGDRAFSVAMWRKHGSIFAWEPMSILQQRFLSLQVTFTYLAVGWQKLIIPDWRSGDILLQGFTGRWATPFGRFFARTFPHWVFDSAIHVTVLFECLMPFGLWIRKLQPWFFVGGCIFHTMISLTMDIWWFQVLVPLYIVFLTPEEVFDACVRLSRGRIDKK